MLVYVCVGNDGTVGVVALKTAVDLGVSENSRFTLQIKNYSLGDKVNSLPLNATSRPLATNFTFQQQSLAAIRMNGLEIRLRLCN